MRTKTVGVKKMSKIKSQKEQEFRMFGLLFTKRKGNIYLKFAKPIIPRGVWHDSQKYQNSYQRNDQTIRNRTNWGTQGITTAL